ncbi:MAG: phospholipase D-like domain-containing protein [Granulosicoccus sp.]
MRTLVPPPASVGLAGEPRQAVDIRFFRDDSWIDAKGRRQLSHTVFDAVFESIERARSLILVDMFLFNAWQGPAPESHRSLADELVKSLLARKAAAPDIRIVLVSDPINTVYGGLESKHFQTLRAGGIDVIVTRLQTLQDSNPTWSAFWRVFIAPWGNSTGKLLPNPFGDGRVSLRSYLAMLNFKANHRKLLVSDDGQGQLTAMVSSANPHDGSSAHRNVAARFGGLAAHDLLASELSLLKVNGNPDVTAAIEMTLKKLNLSIPSLSQSTDSDQLITASSLDSTIQVISESRIHDVVLRLLDSASENDAVDLAMFYLSDRHIVRQLIAARQRGANVRVLLDVNNDAFGRQKNGVPNRPVAAELAKAGVEVRWCATQGEQCHAKWLHVAVNDMHAYVLGSANFTRRNLHDFNLETNILVSAPATDSIVADMNAFFNDQWNNTLGRTYSLPYDAYSNEGFLLKAQYRFMEATGLSTF